MNEKELNALLKLSDVEVSSDFNKRVMSQVYQSKDKAQFKLGHGLLAGALGCLMIFTLMPIATHIFVDWMMGYLPDNTLLNKDTIIRPLQLILVIFAIICSSQCYKIYRLRNNT